MLDTLKTFLADLATGGKRQDHFADTDYRLAAAALLIHAGTLDGDMSAFVRDKLLTILKYRFDLSDAATSELIDEASAADWRAVCVYHFTSLVNRSLD